MGHGSIDHGFTGFWQSFIIFTQSSIFTKPRKSAFHHPAMWPDHKSFCILRAFDNLQYPMAGGLNPGDQLSSITAIGPNQCQARQLAFCSFKNQLSAIPVLDVCRVHNCHQNKPENVHQQVPFASLYLLTRIKTTSSPFSAVLAD